MSVLDSSGFTRQTETLLHGVGAQHLVKEFKRRNISSNVLLNLTKEDFIQLGADEALAESMASTLRTQKKKDSDTRPKLHEMIFDKVQILQIGRIQLDLLRNFIMYCKCRLQKERIDFFIEPDKALRGSQVLCAAADSMLNEVNEAELKLKELEAVITNKPKTNYSYMWYCIPFGGLSLVTSALLYSILKKR